MNSLFPLKGFKRSRKHVGSSRPKPHSSSSVSFLPRPNNGHYGAKKRGFLLKTQITGTADADAKRPTLGRSKTTLNYARLPGRTCVRCVFPPVCAASAFGKQQEVALMATSPPPDYTGITPALEAFSFLLPPRPRPRPDSSRLPASPRLFSLSTTD